MEYMRLGDIATYINGYAFKPVDWNTEGLPIVRIQNLTSNNKEFNYYSKEVDDKYRIAKGDILISWSASIGVYEWQCEEAVLNQHIFKVKFDKITINKYYFKYAVDKYLERAMQFMHGSTMKHITKQYFDDILIPVPDMKIQEKVVEVLTKAQELIDKRKEQIKSLDELVKSRFIEMFGDPVRNTKGWEIKKIIDVCDCMVPGRDKPKSFTGNTPWITIDDLKVNSITYTSKSGLGLTDNEISDVKRKKVPKDSVLMSCVGNLGVCSIAGVDLIINQQLHSFQCKDVNNFFLMHYLGFRKDYMNLQASSTVVLYMNKTVCNSIPVYLPPIELQNQFADFVKQVDKLKFEMEESLKELEDNFNSLMQKAFKGEIF